MAAATTQANGTAGSSGDLEKLQAYRNPSLQVGPNRKINVVEAPIHLPKEGEALVHVKTTGICGSDVHLWKSGGIGPLRVEDDYILGHEAAGIVLRVGPGVTNVKEGDRVAIEPNIVCDNCFLCRDGRYNLCQDVQFSGVYPADGSLQRFKSHPAKWLHKIPDHMNYAQGALLEPLSVVMHGITSCGLALGRGVSIHGAGPIGLAALSCARASGAHPIVITDLESNRLEFAKKLVPSCTTYQVDRNLDAEGNANKIRAIFGAGPVSETKASENEYQAPGRTIECTGVESSVATAAYACRRGGTVMVIGVGKSMMDNVPFMHLSLAEKELKFINRYRDTWPAGISAVVGGVVNLDALVTHQFPLEKADEALKLASDPSKGSIKVHVVDEVEVKLE